MSRRHYAHRAPVERNVLAGVAAQRYYERYAEAIESLNPDDSALLKRVYSGTSLRYIAITDGISLYSLRNRFGKTISKLRHPSRYAFRGDYDDDDFKKFVQILQASAESEQEPLTWCDHHGWTEPLGLPNCPECPCELPPPTNPELEDLGRPRSYCSNACRQRAYRRRSANRVVS